MTGTVEKSEDMVCFFFNDTATTEIYTLSLHDALPIYREPLLSMPRWSLTVGLADLAGAFIGGGLRDCLMLCWF